MGTERVRPVHEHEPERQPATVPARPRSLRTRLTVGRADDPLEVEADLVADAVLREIPTSAPPQASNRIQRGASGGMRAASGAREPQPQPTRVRRAAVAPGTIRRKIVVDGKAWGEIPPPGMLDIAPFKPKPGKTASAEDLAKHQVKGDEAKIHRTQFFAHLSTSPKIFRFADPSFLNDYVRNYAKYWVKQPSTFEAVLTDDRLSRVVKVLEPVDKSVVSEIRFEVPIIFEAGGQDHLTVFASNRRHNLLTLTENLQTPPAAKESNSFVLSPADFLAGMKAYAMAQGAALLGAPMFHGFSPNKVHTTGQQVNCKSDVLELPNDFYGKHNAVHAFPSDGPGVVSPPAEVFANVVALASYMYGTDLYGLARRADPARSRASREDVISIWEHNAKVKPTGSEATTLAKRKAAKAAVVQALADLAVAGFKAGVTKPEDVAKDWAARKDGWKLMSALNYVVPELYDLCVNYGGRSEIPTTADVAVGAGEASRVSAAIAADPTGMGEQLIAALLAAKPPKVPRPPSDAAAVGPTHAQKRNQAAKDASDPYGTTTKKATEDGLKAKLAQLTELQAQAVTAGINLASGTVDF